MKRFLCYMVMLLMVFPAATMASNIDLTHLSDQELVDLSASIVTEQQKRSKSESGYLLSGNVGNLFLGLKNVLLQADNGKQIAILVFDFSHQADEAKSFMFATSVKVFQDGIECDSAYFYEHPSSDNSMKEIKKGATLEVTTAFELASKSPIEIEVEELFSFGDERPLSITMNLP